LSLPNSLSFVTLTLLIHRIRHRKLLLHFLPHDLLLIIKFPNSQELCIFKISSSFSLVFPSVVQGPSVGLKIFMSDYHH
jgi:hypothetical protein